MNRETGKVWASQGSTFHKKIYDYAYRIDIAKLVAVPRDYINSWESGHKCEHDGCFKDGSVECHLNDYETWIANNHVGDVPIMTEYFCREHAYENGYCTCCGDFWGGIESFEFDNPLQVCETCLENYENE